MLMEDLKDGSGWVNGRLPIYLTFSAAFRDWPFLRAHFSRVMGLLPSSSHDFFDDANDHPIGFKGFQKYHEIRKKDAYQVVQKATSFEGQ